MKVLRRIKLYWNLIKYPQTGLLMLTGLTGYISASCSIVDVNTILIFLCTLFLVVGGSTVLNMAFDRDIDRKMRRTALRPLPAGDVHFKEAVFLGLSLICAGLVWAYQISVRYMVILFAGFFINVIIYTILLKRKTAWSILWGGLSGGMPILAGRVLGLGRIDTIGILLTSSIVLWIPTHIMTFSMRYYDDYNRAGIPTFPSTYGYHKTRLIIATSCIGAVAAILLGAVALGMAWGYIRMLVVLGAGILVLAFWSVIKPSERINFGLFKYASIYMMGVMLMIMMGVLG